MTATKIWTLYVLLQVDLADLAGGNIPDQHDPFWWRVPCVGKAFDGDQLPRKDIWIRAKAEEAISSFPSGCSFAGNCHFDLIIRQRVLKLANWTTGALCDALPIAKDTRPWSRALQYIVMRVLSAAYGIRAFCTTQEACGSMLGVWFAIWCQFKSSLRALVRSLGAIALSASHLGWSASSVIQEELPHPLSALLSSVVLGNVALESLATRYQHVIAPRLLKIDTALHLAKSHEARAIEWHEDRAVSASPKTLPRFYAGDERVHVHGLLAGAVARAVFLGIHSANCSDSVEKPWEGKRAGTYDAFDSLTRGKVSDSQEWELAVTSLRTEVRFWLGLGPKSSLFLSFFSTAPFYCEPPFLDLVMIVGDHRSKDIEQQLRSWTPFLRPGGLVVGKDWLPAKRASDVLSQILAVMPPASPLSLDRTGSYWWRIPVNTSGPSPETRGEDGSSGHQRGMGRFPSAVSKLTCTENAHIVDVAQCARHGMVVASTASREYRQSMRRLANSAQFHGGFPCIIVYAHEDFPELCHERILPLLAEQVDDLLPEPEWCDKTPIGGPWGYVSKEHLWGWRRTHLYKTVGYHGLLSLGFDLLLIDSDVTLVREPFYCLEIMKMQGCDVLAGNYVSDSQSEYLDFSVSWTRSTDASVQMAKRVQNRSAGAWDQFVWNQELRTSNLTICVWQTKGSLYRHHFEDVDSSITKPARSCAQHSPTLPPLPGAAEPWEWRQQGFNDEGWLTTLSPRIRTDGIKVKCDLSRDDEHLEDMRTGKIPVIPLQRLPQDAKNGSAGSP